MMIINKFLLNFFIIVLISFQSYSQNTTNNYNKLISAIIPEGYFILLHPYTFQVDTSLNLEFYFNEVKLSSSKYGSIKSFNLFPLHNGYLSVYQKNNDNTDSLLLTKQYMQFKQPEYTIAIGDYVPGDFLNLSVLREKELEIQVINNDISLDNLVISSAKVCYSKSNEINCINLNNDDRIPKHALEEISKNNVNVLIFHVSVLIGEKKYSITPFAFYIQK